MLKVINVVGARPNFMKMAPILAAMDQRPGEFQHLLVPAGAFLFAATHGYSHAQAALLGNRAAAAVVSQHGNRLTPEKILAIKLAFERDAQQAVRA